MVTRLHRFDFGNLRDFRAPIVASAVPEPVLEDIPPPPPPPPTFSEAELEAARANAKQAGFAEGFEAGMARAAEQADTKRQMADTTILQLGAALNDLTRDYHTLLRDEANALSQLVLMVSRKVTSIILDTHGAESVAKLVEQCLGAVFSKPRLTVELNPDAFEATIDCVEKLLYSNGFEGELQFRSNPTLGMHDIVLDWGSGQASRSIDAIWTEVESLLNNVPIQLSLPEPLPAQDAPAAEEVTQHI